MRFLLTFIVLDSFGRSGEATRGDLNSTIYASLKSPGRHHRQATSDIQYRNL